MSSRRLNVRIKVVALLLSLVALWAFAATVTLREGLNLLQVSTLAEDVGKPADALIAELQKERRLSLVYLGGGTSQQQAGLDAQRVRTDKVKATWERSARSGAVERAASDTLGQRIDEAFDELAKLGQ